MYRSSSAVPPSFAFLEPRFPFITVVLVGQIKQLTLKYTTFTRATIY
jgi:hypothetical protein